MSIASFPAAVKAQSTQHSPAHEADLKDSVKSEQNDFSKLVQALMAAGHDVEVVNGFAQAIGLDQPRPSKIVVVPVGDEARKCSVVYIQGDDGENSPLCVYLVRSKKTKTDVQERFFRVNLNGTLEKVITLRNKLDENGKALREGRSKIDEDIASPDVQKIFRADMKYWVKDWLKKEKKMLARADKSDAPKEAAPTAAAPTAQ